MKGLLFDHVRCIFTSSIRSDVTASFVLMDIQGYKVTVYVYKTSPDGKFKVEKAEFTKSEAKS